MELDEMKATWQQLERRLDRQDALQRRLYRERRLDRLHHGLRPLIWGQSLQIAFGIFFMLLGVDFWASRAPSMHILIWGISVQVFGMLMILSAARNLQLVKRIDYALPVLEIQRRLATLRAWRIRVEAPVFSVIGCFIWIPLILIWIQWDWDAMGSSGPDFWARFPEIGSHLLLSGLVSLLLVFGTYWLLRGFGRRRWMEDNFAGSSVRKAEAVLGEIERFENDNG
ncbi:MAG: hypothetical protein ABI129_06055 [Rhodanobacter sp.]